MEPTVWVNKGDDKPVKIWTSMLSTYLEEGYVEVADPTPPADPEPVIAVDPKLVKLISTSGGICYASQDQLEQLLTRGFKRVGEKGTETKETEAAPKAKPKKKDVKNDGELFHRQQRVREDLEEHGP